MNWKKNPRRLNSVENTLYGLRNREDIGVADTCYCAYEFGEGLRGKSVPFGGFMSRTVVSRPFCRAIFALLYERR